MNSLLQPGQHPDAEQLSAFTDHALPAHEQEQMLAHLNGCRECRNRVYMAQQANPVQVAQTEVRPARFRGWFVGWRLAVPAVALACLILLTIYLRNSPVRHSGGTGNETASNAPVQPEVPTKPVVPAAPIAEAPVRAPGKAAEIPAAKRKPVQPVVPEKDAAVSSAAVVVTQPLVSARATIAANGTGTVEGTILDSNGAAIPGAQVTLTNTDTGVQFNRSSGKTGTYAIAALPPGNYNLEVFARGFQRLLQEKVTVAGDTIAELNPKLTVGALDETVTVTNAPPMLNATDATLGGTIENELYSQLPLKTNSPPRDPAAFEYVMPGVQDAPAASGAAANNGTSGIYGGTGQTNLNENYVEGVPAANVGGGGGGGARAGSATVVSGAGLNAGGMGGGRALPTLPSKLPAVAVVERGGHTLAIDNAGAVFRSDDAGATWSPVPAQWKGRAVSLRLAQGAVVITGTAMAAGAPAAATSLPAAVFEMTTDSGAVYRSVDGRIWQVR